MKQEALSSLDRGNGYSGNPPGPLKPGDFGVHSHPDTAKLLKTVAARSSRAKPITLSTSASPQEAPGPSRIR